ncbi:hypothetical protein [Pedomonas mirosovicensis]|uniref:hypothetical protein n=1 Tax=Pedomonas mirosovicensis TaxID=2908641 RepID=UPI00286EC595|nr:hypothetical protein [Pedomonas mirosovicensis]
MAMGVDEAGQHHRPAPVHHFGILCAVAKRILAADGLHLAAVVDQGGLECLKPAQPIKGVALHVLDKSGSLRGSADAGCQKKRRGKTHGNTPPL